MGLDGVELLMATEERFGIEITDQEAETVRTVGDLIELVSNKVAISNESTCFTRKAFYLIRRSLIRLTRAPRAAIRPGTEIKTLSPAVNEKQFWQSLQKELGATSWPDLQYPRTISFAIGATSILVFVGVLWLWAKLIGLLTLVFGFAIAIAASVVFAQQLMGMTAGLRTEIPDSRQTVGALANYIVNRNPELIAVAREQWTQERIRLCVKEVISDQLGLPVERLHDGASFVDDLGVD